MKIIECVPNYSEGRNTNTFELMRESVKNLNDVSLLSLEPDGDYNRVVVTLAGSNAGILEGALAVSTAAASQIDMRVHRGEHPRIGAIDVVPFIPVKNTTMQECVEISKAFGSEISKKLHIPVYLYEEASDKAWRKNLSDIRKGEYEGLSGKLLHEDWHPDFGDCSFNEKLGAAVTGARFFLVAYNVNIQFPETLYAKDIAETLRESGKIKRDAEGKPVKIDGKTVKIPGKLKSVKAMGVFLEKYGITQVSMNLTNYTITPMHVAFEEVKKEAAKAGIHVSGSEIVGLVPLEAMLQAGRYYAGDKKYDEKSLVELAIEKLGLNDLSKFEPEQKIIDYMI
jgi:glutamate formiminotransferase/formiminotetrahydrofolate cyclodeaminase